MSVEEERLWATWIVEQPREGEAVRRLVCALASSEQEAQEESGFIYENFHPATKREEEIWDHISGTPFTEGDLSMLLSLLRRQQRKLGGARRKRPNMYSDILWRLRVCAELRARLETFEGTSDEEHYDDDNLLD